MKRIASLIRAASFSTGMLVLTGWMVILLFPQIAAADASVSISLSCNDNSTVRQLSNPAKFRCSGSQAPVGTSANPQNTGAGIATINFTCPDSTPIPTYTGENETDDGNYTAVVLHCTDSNGKLAGPVAIGTFDGAGSGAGGSAGGNGCPKTAVIKIDCSNKTNPIYQGLQYLLNFLIELLFPIAVLIIVISGIQYTVSQGDPAAIKGAKTRIINAVIGLALLSLVFVIIKAISGS